MEEYIIIEKGQSEFQKLLNQWRHDYSFEVIWCGFSVNERMYHAIIKRVRKNHV